jgi:polysaccharide biosynthesis/export protein
MMNPRAALGRAASAALGLALLAGCAAAPPQPGLAAAPPPHVPTDYLIGPGDLLNVVVWRNPEASQVAPVRPDGKITTPLVEDMPAIGKTPSQLARDMEKVLAKYIREPVVSIVVTNFVGPYSEQVRVIGEAAKPQALPYRKDMTLLDVMIAVGGISEFAAGNRASLMRGASREPIRIRLHDLLKRGDLSANIELRPGDVILIPESLF